MVPHENSCKQVQHSRSPTVRFTSSYHYPPPYIAVASSFACFPPSPISLPTPQRQPPCRAVAAERNTLCLLQLMIMYLPGADAVPDWLHLPLPFCGGSDDYGGILFDVPRNGATLKMQIGPYREPSRSRRCCRLSPFPPGTFSISAPA